MSCVADLYDPRRREAHRRLYGDYDPTPIITVPPAFIAIRERWLARDRERREQRRAGARR